MSTGVSTGVRSPAPSDSPKLDNESPFQGAQGNAAEERERTQLQEEPLTVRLTLDLYLDQALLQGTLKSRRRQVGADTSPLKWNDREMGACPAVHSLAGLKQPRPPPPPDHPL